MMKAAPAASLIVSEPDLLLELLIVALNAPAQFSEIDQLAEADLLRQGREPVFGRFLFALRPLDQQPLLRSVFTQAVTMSNQNPHPRKARAQPVGRTFPHLISRQAFFGNPSASSFADVSSGSPRRPLVGGLPPRFGSAPDGHTKVFD